MYWLKVIPKQAGEWISMDKSTLGKYAIQRTDYRSSLNRLDNEFPRTSQR